MDKKEIREEAQVYFIPFLLGSNSKSHRLSRKIYRKYKIPCYVLDTRIRLADVIDVSSKFIRLTRTQSKEITVNELVYLSNQGEYTLPILIPCSVEYEELVNDMRELLEASFVISSAENVFRSSPLCIIP